MRSALLAAIFCFTAAAAAAQGAQTTYHGACDGSAAVALDADHFVSANDDENSLRIYRIGAPHPIARINLNPALRPERKKDDTLKEVDIEAAARVGDRIYWIASHANDGDGNKERSRHRFFATDIGKAADTAPFNLKPTSGYTDLVKDLIEQLPGLELADSAERSPEHRKGLNIEGLAATSDGKLMIGLRNPRPGHKAIVVPFNNPAAVIDEHARPQFGTPEHLSLGKRGIRSIDRIGDRYVIVAGPFGDDDNDFAIYTWSGPGGAEPREETGINLGTMRPEALFAMTDPLQVYLLSDDGTKACKKLGWEDQDKKTFVGRAIRLAH